MAATLATYVSTSTTTFAQGYPHYASQGSTFVPLDSWVYPLFDRLAARGYIQSAIFGIKPWTRTECARVTDEASDNFRERIISRDQADELSAQMIGALEVEFARELAVLGGGRNNSAALESVYARARSISGPPLTDGYHFGQTVAYDFGRPFRRGTNVIAGGAARATYGPIAIHVGAEFQHSPSAPPLSNTVLDLMASLDQKPRETPHRFAAINRPRWMDTYVSVNFRNWQFTVGNQSLSWGVGSGESLILSNNAEPLPMIRLTRTLPLRLPSVLKFLGPFRMEAFATRLEGPTFVAHPFLYGGKMSFKPHPRFEMTFARTNIIGGHGFPLNTRVFLENLLGIPDANGNRPGDDRDSMDFAFQIRKTVYFYSEFYAEDDPIFFHTPKRGAYRPGIYLTTIPGVSRVDLRVEATSTMSSAPTLYPPVSLNYWNFQYRDGYANRGFPMATATGRAGRSLQIVSNYWLSPREFVRFAFRRTQIQPSFLKGGGSWDDYSVSYQKAMAKRIYLNSSLQMEYLRHISALFAGRKANVTATLELRYCPEGGGRFVQ